MKSVEYETLIEHDPSKQQIVHSLPTKAFPIFAELTSFSFRGGKLQFQS